MLPAIALVGRPNVGKSTLFNRLTQTRDALVADYPGLTRDRRYGIHKVDDRSLLVIDTGGLVVAAESGIAALVAQQVEIAVDEANAIVLVVDHKTGLTAEDRAIAEMLRRASKPVVIAVNKTEGVLGEVAEAEFHTLGLGDPISIAALHGQGIDELVERLLAPFADASSSAQIPEHALEGPRVAVIGRPNVGKSTLINRLIGANRLITSAEPGTTRDSVFVPCERDGARFVLIDTAGIRRRARVSEAIEKYSIVQSLQAIEEAGAVIALLDASEGVTEQDLHLIGLAGERGRALTIGINKWDGLPTEQRRQVEGQVERKLDFVAHASLHYISALHGSGISELVKASLAAYKAAGTEIPTPRLNKILQDALRVNAPPLSRGRPVRLRYAHQGGRYPPLIVIHGNQVERLPDHYRRYLQNAFRQALRLKGTPVKVEFRNGDNPFAGRRNLLTPRQAQRKRRLIRHSRRRDR